MNRMMSVGRRFALLLIALTSAVTAASAQGTTLQGGIQEKSVMTPQSSGSSYSTYPAPQMIQPQPKAPPMQGNAFSNQGRAQADSAPPQHVIQGGVSKVALPPGFMGSWLVKGDRTKVEAASPANQAGFERSFSPNTTNVWTIKGSAHSGYTIGSDSGTEFPLYVEKLAGGAAFVRYQHPVYSTNAQEAIVMTLGNGGTTFEGLERVSIVKQGEPQPRCKVQYHLIGQRQH